MPIYYAPSGHTCTADEALSFGHLKPGYRETIAPGEHVHFDIMMRDAAPSRSVFLTDASAGAILTDIAQQRASHDHKFGWMGANAPAFDEAKAELIATSRQYASAGRLVRDAAREAATLPAGQSAYGSPQANLSDGRDSSWKDEGYNVSAAAVRDAVRANQYR
jgi:hypothetical protein